MDSPQSWNRFSYVSNNPVRFNDPTGHVLSSPNNELPPVVLIVIGVLVFGFMYEHPERRHDAIGENCKDRLAECFNNKETKTFTDYQPIDSQEFNEMLDAIDTDLKRKWRTPYDLARMGYDTPFFNGDSISPWDDVDDRNVCINDKCSPQSAVNYVAQGMYSAYTGQSLDSAKKLADRWNSWAHMFGSGGATDDELYWLEYGYNYYNTKNKKAVAGRQSKLRDKILAAEDDL